MKTTFLYALCEPGTRTVRYIGKTTNLKKRLWAHLHESSTFKTHLGCWLRKLIFRGEVPDMVELRRVEGDGSEAEIRFIRLARGCKMDLVNSTDGGDGVTMTPEIRSKISAAGLGRVVSQETRDRQSAARLGITLSPEHRASLSKALIGKPKSPEHCAAIKAKRALQTNNRGPSKWSEKRRALFELQRGVPKGPLSEAHKAAVSAGRIAGIARRKQQDQDIEWALAPYTLE